MLPKNSLCNSTRARRPLPPNPSRGKVWLVDLGMAAKTRPGLIWNVSRGDADRALATLLPHTTSTRGSRLEVSTTVGFLHPRERSLPRTLPPLPLSSCFANWVVSAKTNGLPWKTPFACGWDCNRPAANGGATCRSQNLGTHYCAPWSGGLGSPRSPAIRSRYWSCAKKGAAH